MFNSTDDPEDLARYEEDEEAPKNDVNEEHLPAEVGQGSQRAISSPWFSFLIAAGTRTSFEL